MHSTQRQGWIPASWIGVMVVCLAPAAQARAQESWDAIFRGEHKIGHIHTFIEPVKDKGRKLLRVRVDMELNFRRGRDQVTIKQRYGSIETPEGSVLRLDHRTLASEQETRTHGDVIDGKMVLMLETEGNGKLNQQQASIPWEPDVRGPYAPEQSLARHPIKPGETRLLKMYMPDLNKICEVTLAAKGMEDVLLGDGKKRPLLRVDQTTTLDGKPRSEFDVVLWVDEGGQILKSYQNLLGGLSVYRTTKEGAMTRDSAVSVDSIVESIIKVPNKIGKSTSRHDIRYRVKLDDADPSEIIPADRRQTIQPGTDQKSVLLEVRTAGPNDGQPGAETVDEAFLRSNPLITSEDPLVRSLARDAVGKATDPWEKAVKIESWVAKKLREKNFSTTFAPASEVARNLSGDCTEHSVLAAAMHRAAGIPARVAVGLVYVDHLGGFGFHMWNEVYINRRWVALDAAFDQSSVDATHIKLNDTSLDGVAPYEAFLPVARVMGKMSIEPLEIR